MNYYVSGRFIHEYISSLDQNERWIMPLEIETLDVRVFRDQIEEAILKALRIGDLKPGDQVKEAVIADQAGISRGPVREAIQHLVGEGLLVYKPHRGTFVAEWTDKDIREIYSVRALLEGYSARLAVQIMTNEHLAELSAIIDEMVQKANQGDDEGVFDCDLLFHQRINEFSGLELVSKLLVNLRRRINFYIKLDEDTTPSLEQYARNHYMLLESLKSKDAEKAEAVFRDHLESVGKTLADRYKQKMLEKN
jgi:DNA-binding GntR family transcriptional regulator